MNIDLNEIKAILDISEEIMPIVDEMVEKTISAASHVKPVFETFRGFIVDQTAKMFFELIDKGLTRDEALQIVIAIKSDMKNSVRSSSKK